MDAYANQVKSLADLAGSNPVLTTKNKIMCNITPLEAIGICALIFIIAGIYIYIKSDGMGVE